MAAGLRQVRRAARPGGRDGGGVAAAERHRDRAGPRAARGHRLHLRIAPQRDGGRRRALREVGQRRRAARRQRGASSPTPLIAAVLAKALEKAGRARRRHPVHRHPRPRGGGGDAQAGRSRRPHHPARRRGAFVRWVAERSRIPILKHDKGALPRVRRRAPPTSTWRRRSCSTRRRSGRACATRWRRCSSHRAVAARFLPLVAARLGDAGVELRGCPQTRGAACRTRAAGRRAADWDDRVPRPHPGRAGGRRPRRRRSSTSAVTAPGWPRPS